KGYIASIDGSDIEAIIEDLSEVDRGDEFFCKLPEKWQKKFIGYKKKCNAKDKYLIILYYDGPTIKRWIEEKEIYEGRPSKLEYFIRDMIADISRNTCLIEGEFSVNKAVIATDISVTIDDLKRIFTRNIQAVEEMIKISPQQIIKGVLVEYKSGAPEIGSDPITQITIELNNKFRTSPDYQGIVGNLNGAAERIALVLEEALSYAGYNETFDNKPSLTVNSSTISVGLKGGGWEPRDAYDLVRRSIKSFCDYIEEAKREADRKEAAKKTGVTGWEGFE
ncbi:TPA: hypothetical protein HA317_02240, partial [Candidatus Woesearchaeota archaeon]|nr:hypothetical protein [Candidatus Woesearchaeota archaeon]